MILLFSLRRRIATCHVPRTEIHEDEEIHSHEKAGNNGDQPIGKDHTLVCNVPAKAPPDLPPHFGNFRRVLACNSRRCAVGALFESARHVPKAVAICTCLVNANGERVVSHRPAPRSRERGLAAVHEERQASDEQERGQCSEHQNAVIDAYDEVVGPRIAPPGEEKGERNKRDEDQEEACDHRVG